jgi:HTH-type transcriptional regulator / antitoxin HigA
MEGAAMSTKMPRIKISDSYLELVKAFPLRPIRSGSEYAQATRVMEKLAVRGEDDLDDGERDYLDALDEFISAYDRSRLPTGIDRRSPLERLSAVLEHSGTTPAQLRRILGCSQPLVSMILHGQRELSKDNIARLANHFKLGVAYFF